MARPPEAKGAVVVLRGRRVVKKTYVRKKFPINVVGSSDVLLSAIDEGFGEDGSPNLVEDGIIVSEQGGEGTPAFSL